MSTVSGKYVLSRQEVITMSAPTETLLRDAAICLQRVEDQARQGILDLGQSADFRGIIRVVIRLEELDCEQKKARRVASLN